MRALSRGVCTTAAMGEISAMRMLGHIGFAGVSLMALSAPAFGQSADNSTSDAAGNDDIVVTGTLIRNAAPIGSQSISIESAAITEKAAASTNELLSLIPQISNTFNGRFEGDPRGVSAGISITKPNLRNLPGANSTSGGTTLVLMDGFRFTPVGVNQSSVDVDIIPAAVIAGIDVVTDGGTSLYGADAVAGVINFRTLRKFEGIKVDANYGFGTTLSNFDQWDAQLTAGKSWSTGNFYISGGYSHRDLVLNNETTWATGEIYNTAGVPRFTGTQCNNPVGTETRWYRFGPGATQFTNNAAAPGAGTFAVGTACDNVGQATYSPGLSRYNAFAQLTNEFSDSISLRMTAYWTKRDLELGIFPRGVTSAGSGITTGAQVGALPGAAATPIGSVFAVTEGVGFSLAPNVAYVNTPQTVGFETWGITPEVTVKLGADWQLRTSAHFGQSTNYQAFPSVDTVLAQNYINSGQLNPRNAAAASASVVRDLIDYENAQDTNQQLFVLRAVGDGPLFALPGGDAKLAVGAEFQDNQAKSRVTSARVGAIDTLPWTRYGRHSISVFGELSLPVTTFLDVSASVRYDHYSDFGSTTNPNIGATLKPTDWLKIFGHWNTSFNAPTAVDGLGLAVGRFSCGIYTPGVGTASRPYDPYTPKKDNGQGTCALVSEGVKAGIRPQTAQSWAVGFEATPLDGLRVGGEFYSIDFNEVLGAVNPQNLNTYVTNPELYNYAITAAQYAAFLSELTNGTALAAQQANSTVAIYVDRRTSNIGTATLQGIDFHVYYDRDLADGRLSLGLVGTKTTKSVANFGVETNELGNGSPEFVFTTFAGYKVGGFSSRVTVNYSGVFHDDAPDPAGVLGARIDPFTTVNLSLGYEFGETRGALSGTSLRLTVDNLFEEKPQVTPRGAANISTYRNWTLGRVIKFGVSKKF
jgi:iron complex outermembrane receptor protein